MPSNLKEREFDYNTARMARLITNYNFVGGVRPEAHGNPPPYAQTLLCFGGLYPMRALKPKPSCDSDSKSCRSRTGSVHAIVFP